MQTEHLDSQINEQYLQDFAEAWNRHDLQTLMSFMSEDCVFQLSSGPDVDGTRYTGYKEVEKAFQKILDLFPDCQWTNPRHFISGNRGVTQWTFVATNEDGSTTEVDGCDLFTFTGNKIAVKNSFRKIRL